MYYGRIVDDYNVKLHNVDIYINDIKTSASECKGKFDVQAQIGDTIRFQKKGYVSFETILKRKRRVKVELIYDYLAIKKNISDYYSTFSQPCNNSLIFIIDGILYEQDNSKFHGLGEGEKNNTFLSEKDIEAMITVNRQEAINLFDEPDGCTIILTTTNCNYNPK